ncbi:MAG TPA: glycosyltransferase family 87 protein [Blastocatellia bacterium]|nr:glycosyltransferase family 87 protein [Blastocatellia bacterium]HMY74436.1 glycosyltransferase family 87 protein [Blastocatellia bacterium]HMZ22793.1 glycosyltransferase family 87 protein [Blastocatellia bacterium]HNG29530.1 glycosyltransferase family 87 protein [Blastocatellia bacterium]
MNFAPISKRSYMLFSLLGTAVLLLVHWKHSWPALSHGYAFADLGDSERANTVNEAVQTTVLACLFGLYFYCLLHWERLQFTRREIAFIVLAQGLIGWASLPANSTDLFGYIGLGRLAAVYGANPYLHTYAEFHDNFRPYVEWYISMPYGPALLPLFAAAGWLSQYGVLPAVFALKLVWLLTHICNCLVLARILNGWGKPVAIGVFLFGLNPLVWLEQIVNGHNDGVLMLFGLLAILALQRGWRVAAVWLALLSALVKLPGIFFFAAVLIYLLRRRDWRALAIGLTGSAVLLLALKLALFPTKESMLSLTNVGNYSKNSLHLLLIRAAEKLCNWLGGPTNYDHLYALDRRVFSVLFFAFCAWRFWRIRELNHLIQELAVLFLGLLIGYAAWFFPWYVAWLIPLAALMDSARLRWTILAFSWTSLALYAFSYQLIELSPRHWLWMGLRISIAHLLPLSLPLLWTHLNRRRELPLW